MRLFIQIVGCGERSNQVRWPQGRVVGMAPDYLADHRFTRASGVEIRRIVSIPYRAP